MDKEFLDAKRVYLERSGSAIVTNRWLLLLLFVSLLLHGAAAGFIWHLYGAAEQKRLVVVHIDEIGRPTAVNYDASEYKPQERDLRYFLMHFEIGRAHV